MHTHEDFSELVIVLNGIATHLVNDEEFVTVMLCFVTTSSLKMIGILRKHLAFKDFL